MRRLNDRCEKFPHLGEKSPRDILEELEHLRFENGQLRSVFETATEAFSFKERDKKIGLLEEENAVLRKKLQDAHQKPFVIGKKKKGEQSDDKTPGPSSRPRGAPKGHRGGSRQISHAPGGSRPCLTQARLPPACNPAFYPWNTRVLLSDSPCTRLQIGGC